MTKYVFTTPLHPHKFSSWGCLSVKVFRSKVWATSVQMEILGDFFEIKLSRKHQRNMLQTTKHWKTNCHDYHHQYQYYQIGLIGNVCEVCWYVMVWCSVCFVIFVCVGFNMWRPVNRVICVSFAVQGLPG